MSELKHVFAENLRVRRTQKQWTQAKLADVSGVGVDAIGKYERCLCSPTLPNIVKLAKALGCTPDELCEFKKFSEEVA